MANITRRGEKWRAFVCKNGIRKSATFETRQKAAEWAVKTEAELDDIGEGILLSKVLDRYLQEITPKKRSVYNEMLMVKMFRKTPFAQKPINAVTPMDIRKWRDSRVKEVLPSTVRRELTLLSSVFRVAVNEWELLASNPCSKVKRPDSPKPRNRRISDPEIQEIAVTLGWKPNQTISDIASEIRPIYTVGYSGHFSVETRIRRHIVAVAFLFAVETGMRLGEILALKWDNVDEKRRTAFLTITKNGDSRVVPLSRRAIGLLGQVRTESPMCFSISKDTFKGIFRWVKKVLGVHDLHFHDTRHEAVTRLAQKLEVLDLARMIGHRNISQLMTYYNATPEEIAQKLD